MDSRDSDAVDSGRITAYGSRRPGGSNRANTAVYDAARYAAPSSSSSSARGVIKTCGHPWDTTRMSPVFCCTDSRKSHE